MNAEPAGRAVPMAVGTLLTAPLVRALPLGGWAVSSVVYLNGTWRSVSSPYVDSQAARLKEGLAQAIEAHRLLPGRVVWSDAAGGLCLRFQNGCVEGVVGGPWVRSLTIERWP